MNNQSFDPNAYGNQPASDQNQTKNDQSSQQNGQQQAYGAGNSQQQPYNGQPYNGQPYGGQPNGQPYGNPYGQSYNPYQPPVQPAHNLAMASLICGIISFFCCGLPLSIAGLVCALKAKKAGNTEGITTVGLILGIVGIILNAISVVAVIVIMPMYITMLEESFRQVMFIFLR